MQISLSLYTLVRICNSLSWLLPAKGAAGCFIFFFLLYPCYILCMPSTCYFCVLRKKNCRISCQEKKCRIFPVFCSILTTVDPIKKIAPFFPIFICPFLLLCSDPLTTNISVRLGVCLNSPKRGKNCSRAKFCPALPNTTVSCNLVWPKTFPISSWSVCTSLAASELKYRSIVLFLPSQLLLGLGRSLLCTDPTMDIISMCVYTAWPSPLNSSARYTHTK